MPSSSSYIEGTQVYMNGVCHWLSDKDSIVGRCLVSFYLSNEVFFITPTPSHGDYFEFVALWIKLVVLNGSIALISCHEDTTIHISILGEFGTKEPWTKLLIVGPLPCVGHPIGVGMQGEIFFVREDEEIVWLDLSTQMIVELGYKGVACSSRIIIYKESVFPIRGTNLTVLFPDLILLVSQVILPSVMRSDSLAWFGIDSGDLSLKDAYAFKVHHTPQPQSAKSILETYARRAFIPKTHKLNLGVLLGGASTLARRQNQETENTERDSVIGVP
ncbi:F-box protein [Trifolium pratense]|uniref:F-box protein n=1 Tax=Trifolium pratense TaxID=57577 RepID=A0A2K3N9D0_TRIPR|nr:F-box protein [Trifolium pratense]